MSRFIVEIVENAAGPGGARTVRLGPYHSEESGRAGFARETFGMRDYWGLPADGCTEEVRLVEEFEARPHELYGARRLVDLVVKFCARCDARGESWCAEAAEEVERRAGVVRTRPEL